MSSAFNNLQVMEMGTAMMKRNWGVIPDPPPIKFAIVDRNLIRTAAMHVMEMIEDKVVISRCAGAKSRLLRH